MKKIIFILFIAHCSLQIVNAQQSPPANLASGGPTEEWVRRFSWGSNNFASGLSVKLNSAGNVLDTNKLVLIK